MQFGAHLPLIELDAGRPTLAGLRDYARRAAELGYGLLCANDHLLFSRPWLDGPTALAATLDAAEGMSVATTVCLPVIRGPAPTAAMLTALHQLSGGRLVAGVGPGSSPRDYAAIGVPFEDRWARFDAAVRELRPLLDGGPPVWIASWGSPAGLRRVARLGDGWLASGYNTTPARFRDGASFLAHERMAAGREELPNGLATMWLYVTERRRDADRVLTDVLAPLVGRPVEELRDLALPIGSAEQCAERISAYRDAGAQRVFVWPLADDVEQLRRFAEDVVPRVGTV